MQTVKGYHYVSVSKHAQYYEVKDNNVALFWFDLVACPSPDTQRGGGRGGGGEVKGLDCVVLQR